MRNQLDKYASPDKVDWHLACISNRWTKRALASAGFGFPTPRATAEGDEPGRWKPIFSVAELGGHDSAAAVAEVENERQLRKQRTTRDIESGVEAKDHITTAAPADGASHSSSTTSPSPSGNDLRRTLSQSKAYNKGGAVGRVAVVHGLNRPLFHIDLTSALQSAVANVESREQEATKKKGVGTDAQ